MALHQPAQVNYRHDLAPVIKYTSHTLRSLVQRSEGHQWQHLDNPTALDRVSVFTNVTEQH